MISVDTLGLKHKDKQELQRLLEVTNNEILSILEGLDYSDLRECRQELKTITRISDFWVKRLDRAERATK